MGSVAVNDNEAATLLQIARVLGRAGQSSRGRAPIWAPAKETKEWMSPVLCFPNLICRPVVLLFFAATAGGFCAFLIYVLYSNHGLGACSSWRRW